ncbi:MAG: hypothetical protein KGL39_45420 [Patescibacteria group bacterium]|nr:hypothetical protein [Patescibacteria group bacterium]
MAKKQRATRRATRPLASINAPTEPELQRDEHAFERMLSTRLANALTRASDAASELSVLRRMEGTPNPSNEARLETILSAAKQAYYRAHRGKGDRELQRLYVDSVAILEEIKEQHAQEHEVKAPEARDRLQKLYRISKRHPGRPGQWGRELAAMQPNRVFNEWRTFTHALVELVMALRAEEAPLAKMAAILCEVLPLAPVRSFTKMEDKGETATYLLQSEVLGLEPSALQNALESLDLNQSSASAEEIAQSIVTKAARAFGISTKVRKALFRDDDK